MNNNNTNDDDNDNSFIVYENLINNKLKDKNIEASDTKQSLSNSNSTSNQVV